MARVTIEKCLERIPNVFQLTMVAVKRAWLLSSGAEPMVKVGTDKCTVTALREIEAGYIISNNRN